MTCILFYVFFKTKIISESRKPKPKSQHLTAVVIDIKTVIVLHPVRIM
jgi:hypothetical protein